jgi:hypothetical protein
MNQLQDEDSARQDSTEITVASDVSLAVGLTKAEVDQQIATAHRYPRSLQRAVGNIMSMATLDEETAEECTYALPRGNKTIEGPSARFAEIVVQCWGNCRVAARVVREERDYIVAQAVYHDLETNSAISTEVQRRIVDSKGRRYGPDMIVVTGNAACAIARRNIILGGVPRAVWRRAYDAARQVVMGDVKTLGNRRAEALKAFVRYGIQPDKIFAILGVAGEEEITLDHLVVLRGMISALKNNEATAEEMFNLGRAKAPVDEKYNPLVQGKEVDGSQSESANTGGSDEVAKNHRRQIADDAASSADRKIDGTENGAQRDSGVNKPATSAPKASTRAPLDGAGAVQGTALGGAPKPDFGGYHRALLRAATKDGLKKISDEFRSMPANAWSNAPEHKEKLQGILGINQRRVNGEFKSDAAKLQSELKQMGV